jgi:hypothetical protein
VLVVELLALALAMPGSLTALEQLLARRTPAGGPARFVRPEPGTGLLRASRPRTIELAITVRLHRR